MDEVKTWGIDTLILGCTHYPLVSDLIAQKLPGVTLISSGAELAKTLDISENEDFEDEYYATDLTESIQDYGR